MHSTRSRPIFTCQNQNQLVLTVFVGHKNFFKILNGGKSPFCEATGALFWISVDSAHGFSPFTAHCVLEWSDRLSSSRPQVRVLTISPLFFNGFLSNLVTW